MEKGGGVQANVRSIDEEQLEAFAYCHFLIFSGYLRRFCCGDGLGRSLMMLNVKR